MCFYIGEKKLEYKCMVCGRKVDADMVGLNRKLFGKEIKKFYCLDCCSEYLETTNECLLTKIEEYKELGCTLFR